MTLSQLRQVSQPGVRTGQARWRDARGRRMLSAMRLSGLVAYTVLPLLERGVEFEVRWTKLRLSRGIGFDPDRDRWTPWVRITPDG